MVLERTFLIELPPGYEFKTNDETFINSGTIIEEEPLTFPKINVKSETRQKEIKLLELNKIPLDKLAKEEHLDRIHIVHHGSIHTHFSHFWVTPIFILLAELLGFLIYKLKNYLAKKKKPSDKNLTSEEEENLQEKDQFC